MTPNEAKQELTTITMQFHQKVKELAQLANIDTDTITVVMMHRQNGQSEVLTGTTLPNEGFIEVLEDTARNERAKSSLKKTTYNLPAPGKGGTA